MSKGLWTAWRGLTVRVEGGEVVQVVRARVVALGGEAAVPAARVREGGGEDLHDEVRGGGEEEGGGGGWRCGGWRYAAVKAL